MGSTGISGSLSLQHHKSVMLLPPKIFAGNKGTSTIDEGKSKRGSWFSITKPPTEDNVLPHEKLVILIWRTLETTPGQPTSRR
jgi:hypothetical protein